ncbi:MAG TPA: hypothetical protein PK609_00765 [Candidatus Paceibacterota bacterium]|nr:hypothetical protein [Candidatus Paceibacterota bacterium]
MIRSALLILILLGMSGVAQAQALPGSDPITLVVSPQYPRPYQSFTVAPRSSLIDLSGSTVRVSANGTRVYEGSGTQATTIRAGGLGERTTVVVTVIDAAGRTYTKELVIRPAEVSLVQEAVSTVHPFYRGGGLVASEGQVRLVALADMRTAAGARTQPQNLVYTWKLGSRVLTDYSGIGKSTLLATAPVRYRNAEITVTVTSQDQSLVGEARTVISAVDPVARVYQNDPLLGPNFDVALANRFTMPDTEATFRAVGYFFSVPPVFSWTVNNATASADRDITVRATGSGAGTAQLALTATEPETRRSADARVSVDFGSVTGFGFFGL